MVPFDLKTNESSPFFIQSAFPCNSVPKLYPPFGKEIIMDERIISGNLGHSPCETGTNECASGTADAEFFCLPLFR